MDVYVYVGSLLLGNTHWVWDGVDLRVGLDKGYLMVLIMMMIG